MTPQSLSIADLKAVIEFINKYPYPTSNEFDLIFKCEQELTLRLNQMKYPTEPKNEEK